MIIPTFTHDKVVRDDGYFTSPWEILFQTLLQTLQQNVSDEGFVIPSQTSANITRIESNPVIDCRLIYNSDTNKLMVRLADGTFHNVTTS